MVGSLQQNFYLNDSFIKWTDIKSLNYSDRGLYLVSGKLEKYLYAEIIASDKKIVIRRELAGFHELIKEIQDKTGKTFQSEDAVKGI